MKNTTGAIAVAIACLAGSAYGQDDAFWISADGDWSSAASWSLGVVPNNNGDQTFNASLLAIKVPYTVSLDIDVELENFTLDGSGVALDLGFDRVLTVNQNATIANGQVFGSGGKGTERIEVAGTLTLSDAALMGAGDIRASGGINFFSASNVDICNTCVNTGGPATLVGSGGISLNQGGDLTNDEGGTFTIVADSNRSISGDGTGSFNNRGTLNSVVSSRGSVGDTNFSNVNFTNTGTVNAFAGQLFFNTANNLAPDGTLSDGVWNVFNGAAIALGDSVFSTLDAEINIFGPDATFFNIASLNTIEQGGKFGIFDGQDFGDSTNLSFTNSGEIEVGARSTFNAAFNGLNNLDGDAIFGGKYVIEGTFLTGANEISMLEADLTLRGVDSVFTGIQALQEVGSSGRLAIENGRDFDTIGDFSVTDGGLVRIGAGSTFNITGELSNNGVLGLFDAAAFEVEGTLIASNLNIIEISNELILDGADSQLLDGNGNDAIANLQRIRDDGILRLRNGRSISNLDDLIVDGVLSIEGDPPVAGSRGLASGTVQVNGNTSFGASSMLEIVINGTDEALFGQLLSGSVFVEEGATLALIVDPDAMIDLGDEFALVLAGSMSGEFTNLVGLEFGDGLSFEIVQDGAGVFAKVVPAPGFGGLLLAGGMLALRRRR